MRDRAGRGARRRARACSRCRDSPSAARCCCTTIPSGVLEPSRPTIEIAARMHDDGMGFAHHRQRCATELYVVVEVPRVEPMHAGSISRRSTPTWVPMAPSRSCTPRYEDRPGQRVARGQDRAAVQRRRHRAARGGNGHRQVVRLPGAGAPMGGGERRAHGRVHQHHQPAGAARRQGPPVSRARRSSDQPVRFALLKGWRNYLCLLRLEQARTAGTDAVRG